MGYVLSIFLNALQTWLYTKLWDSFFIRRFSGRKFWSYWLLWTAITTVIINVLPYDYDYINILRFLIEIALDYAMSLTLYRSRWDRRLFVVITGYSCFFSIAALTERALLFYSGMTQAEYVYNKPLATVYKGNIIKNLIMDCQSYTKYRPNETTGGIFVSWRRKEELPTGA